MRLLHPGEYKAMTFDEIMKCRPGASLDRLVAEACGIEYEVNPNPAGIHCWENTGGDVWKCSECLEVFYDDFNDAPVRGCKPSPILFRPSSDWNDAMMAAEKAGVFATGPGDLDSFGFVDRVTDGGPYKWRVCRHRFNVYDSLSITVIATAETGPLAICRAILINSRNKESDS